MKAALMVLDLKRNMAKSSIRIVSAIMALMAMIFLGGALSWAAEKNVSEEILDILREKEEISEQQYQELKKKAEAEQEEQSEWKAYWKDGLRVERKDGKIKSRWGGNLHLDWARINADSSFEQDLEDAGEDTPLKGTGVEFRRIHLFTDGLVYNSIGYRVHLDFTGGKTNIRDLYMQLVKVPYVGRIRVGHYKEPFSLAVLTSGNSITFMERALPVEAFAPVRNTGIGIGNNAFEKRFCWDLGFFYDTDGDGKFFDDFDKFQLTARVAGQPWYRDEAHLLHFGLGFSHLFRDEDETDARLRFRTRPEAHITDVRLADTGRFFAENADKLNPELAFVYGPFSLQGEYFWTKTDADVVDDPTFKGGYVFGSWFITGESRAYKQSSATFGRVRPKKNFSIGEPGWGAWELAARYSTVDLTDKDVKGGEEYNITAGLNWYLNPHTRIMFNYVYADLEDRADVRDDNIDIFQARFQISF
jgi:phosphate-selective porin OprO/OprP